MNKRKILLILIFMLCTYFVYSWHDTYDVFKEIENVSLGKTVEISNNEAKLVGYVPEDGWHALSVDRRFVVVYGNKGKMWIHFEFEAIIGDELSYSSDTPSFDLEKREGIWYITKINYDI